MGEHPRILLVQSSKLRLEGNFDFAALAKATPGYVGADLASLTGAAGIVAVKRIFHELSMGSIMLPEINTDALDPASMSIDISLDSAPYPVEPCPFSSYQAPSTPLANSIVHFLRAHPNPLTEAQLSPLNIRYSDFIQALKHVQPSSKREGFATIPDVSWADIGALYHIREELQMAIVQPIRKPELFKAVGIDAGCGVLLWGPPGCGKTLLAKAVANESRANFISVKGPELLNKASPTRHVDFQRSPSVDDRSAFAHDSMLVKANAQYGKYSLVRVHLRRVSSSSMNWMRWSLKGTTPS